MIYERRASPIHAARAAAAGAWCLALTVAALATKHPLLLGALLAVVLLAAAGGRVLGPVARLTAFGVPFALLVALINPLVSHDGVTVIYRLGKVPPFGEVDLTLEALVYGATFGLQLLVVLAVWALATRAVDPDDVLRLFRRVSFRSALTAALAVRLMPVLMRDAQRMAEARRCRADGGGGGARASVAVLRAVTAGALDRATDVAATMEVRGYATASGRVQSARAWSRHDLAFLASALAIVVLVVLARAQGVAGFEAFPRLDVPLGAAEAGLCCALAVAALLPFADRRGIEP